MVPVERDGTVAWEHQAIGFLHQGLLRVITPRANQAYLEFARPVNGSYVYQLSFIVRWSPISDPRTISTASGIVVGKFDLAGGSLVGATNVLNGTTYGTWLVEAGQLIFRIGTTGGSITIRAGTALLVATRVS